MDVLYYNYFSGYWRWVRQYGVLYLGALWLADNYGMMSNGNETFNGLEVINPIFVESSWRISVNHAAARKLVVVLQRSIAKYLNKQLQLNFSILAKLL